MLSFILLLSVSNSFSLFHCLKKAEEKHFKITEQAPTADAFVTEGMNHPQTIILSLLTPELNSIITRSIPHYLFKKSAVWELKIVTEPNNQNNCVAINDLLISSPQESKKNSPHIYSWSLKLQRRGKAKAIATYSAPYRKGNPHVQEFDVIVE